MDRFFLNPWALAFSALAGGIVLLYILKLKRVKVRISSTLLWERTVHDFKANAPWQRLRRNILMLLQILAMILLALALARPFVFGTALSGGKNVLIIDTSASMLATDESGDRLQRAVDSARQMLADLSRNDEAMIVAAGPQPLIITSFTKNKAELLSALDRIREGAGGRADIDAALRLVSSVTAGSGSRVVLFSDGAIDEINPLAIVTDTGESAMSLNFFNIGSAGGNVAIVGSGARFNPFNQDYELFVALQNYYPEDRSVDVTLTVGEELLDVREVSLDGGERHEIVLSNMPYIEEPIAVQIDSDDLLDVDDISYISMPRQDRYKVALCTSGESLLLRRVLGSMDFIELFNYQGTGDTADIDVWIVEGDAPSGIDPTASYLFIDTTAHPFLPVIPGVRAELDFTSDPQVIPTVVGIDRGHELLRFVEVANLQFTATRRSRLQPWGRVLVDGSEGPLMVEGFNDGQRTVYLGFNIYESDLPLKAAFPIFMSNCLRYLGRAASGSSGFSFASGKRIELIAPVGTAAVEVTRPDNVSYSISVSSREFTLSDTTRVGIYELGYFDETGDLIESSFVPVSLQNAEESNIFPAATIRISGAEEIATGLGDEIRGSREIRINREFYTWIILCVLLIMGIEWYLYHTRAL